MILALVACHDDPAAREWPPGTVFAVDDVPVSASEVAEDSFAVMLIEPHSSETQLKRLAFSLVSMPRAVMRTLATKEAREAARRSIDEQFERAATGVGAPVGPPLTPGILGSEVSGTWGALGLVAWGRAMNLELDQWSEVLEEPGGFARVRLLERKEGPTQAHTWLRLDRLEARYVTHAGGPPDHDEELKKHRLTIVDPSWDTIVPERTKYLMGVHEQ